MQIRCAILEWQLSSLGQIYTGTSSLPPVSTLEDLYILENRNEEPLRWQDDIENTLWLDLLFSLVALKNLHLPEEFVPRVAPALQELDRGRTTEVLPTLENNFLEKFQSSGSLHEGIKRFVAARQLTRSPCSSFSRGQEFETADPPPVEYLSLILVISLH